MAVKVGGTEVITNARQLSNIASVDSTTVTALGAAGIGGGGGTTELTAAAALSAGDPVQVNSSGQAEKIALTVGTFTAQSTLAISGDQATYAGVAMNTSTTATDGMRKSVIVWNDGGSNKLQYKSQSVADNGAITNNGGADFNSVASRAVSLIWNDYLGEFAVVYAQTSTGLHLRTFEFGNSSSPGSLTSNTAENIKSHSTVSEFQEAALVYDTLRNRYVSFYTFQTSMRANVCTSTGAGSLSSVADTAVVSSKEIRFIKATGDGSGTFVVNAYDSTGGDQYIYVFALDGSNNVTLQSSAVLDTAAGGRGAVGIAYSSSLDKYLAYYQNGSNGRLRVIDVDKSNSYAITMGTAITVVSSNSSGLRGTVTHDDLTGFQVFFNNTATYIYHQSATVSGNTVSMSGSGTEITSVSSINYDYAFEATANNLGYYSLYFAMNNEMELGASRHATSSTLSSSFVGFAGAAINSGAVGDINVVSSVDTNQSGLISGSPYYVNGAGNLVTTSGGNQYAGLALSGTKLLVKG
jgi:hypothetical protein